MNCACGVECGDDLACRFHRRTATAAIAKTLDRIWHDYIVEHGGVRQPQGGEKEYQCAHCHRWFTREYVCGDHFPFTKGSHPELRWNVKNGKTSCRSCNDPISRNRLENLRKEKLRNESQAQNMASSFTEKST